MHYGLWFSFCILVALLLLVWIQKKEPFCASTGLSYDESPLPEPIKESSKSPPFYDLNARREPLCSYKNYMFPPPMNYGEFEYNPPEMEKQYLYWNTAVLSKPQTPYLV